LAKWAYCYLYYAPLNELNLKHHFLDSIIYSLVMNKILAIHVATSRVHNILGLNIPIIMSFVVYSRMVYNKFLVEASVTNKNKKITRGAIGSGTDRKDITYPYVRQSEESCTCCWLVNLPTYDCIAVRSTVQELFFQAIWIYAYICLIDENPFSKHLWRAKVAHRYRPSRHAIVLSSDSSSCVSNVWRSISMLFTRNVSPNNKITRNV